MDHSSRTLLFLCSSMGLGALHIAMSSTVGLPSAESDLCSIYPSVVYFERKLLSKDSGREMSSPALPAGDNHLLDMPGVEPGTSCMPTSCSASEYFTQSCILCPAKFCWERSRPLLCLVSRLWYAKVDCLRIYALATELAWQ